MSLLPLLLLSFPLLYGAATADTPSEHSALLKIERHLADLELLIESAEQAADPDARIRFRYDWLRRDIAKVRSGVQAHIHRTLAETLENAAIGGDYRR